MAKGHKGLLGVVLLVAAIGLVGTLAYQQRMVQGQLNDLEGVEQVDPKAIGNNPELAEKIVAEVKELIDISDEVNPTVATIVDIEKLQAQNPFYNKAENGDHLIVTPERAILYSSKLKKILDVVPVQLEPVAGEGSEEGSEEQ